MSTSAKPEKKWTPQEDEILRAAVAQFGTKNSWQKISERLPGRSNKSCRKRWIHSLDPQLRKGRWTAAEDAKLKEAIKEHGLQWWKVARQIEGRTDDQCAKRWREKLDPSISRRPWSALEDQTLMDAWRIHGKKWNIISTLLPGRPAVHCRNRYQSLTRVSRRASTSAVSGDSSTPILLASSHGHGDKDTIDRKPSKYDLDSPVLGDRLTTGSSGLNSPFDFTGRRPSWQGEGAGGDSFLGIQRYPADPSSSLSFDSPRSNSGLAMSPASLTTSSPASSEELQLPPALGLDFDARIGISRSGYEDPRYKDHVMGMSAYSNGHYTQGIPSVTSIPSASYDGGTSASGHDHRRMSLPGMSYSSMLQDSSRGLHGNEDNVDVLLEGLSSRWGAAKAMVAPHTNQRTNSSHFSGCPGSNGGPCNCDSLAGQPSNLRAFMELAASKGTAQPSMRGLWPAQQVAGGDQPAFFSPSLGGLHDLSLPGQHRPNGSMSNSAPSTSAGPSYASFEPGFGPRSASRSPMSTAVSSTDTGGAYLVPQMSVITPSSS